MINPFVFGSVVKGPHFCNRNKEIDEITEICHSNNNLILVSPRRYGKTSLVVNALERSKIPYLLIDCTQLDSKEDFVNRILTKYLETLKEGTIIEKVKYLSKILDIEFSVKTGGFEVKVRKFEYSGLEQLLKEVTKNFVIAFDEFQDVFDFDKALVKRLRGILQLINKTTIFLGSKKHMLLYLFENQNSPFYKFGHIMSLSKLEESEWSKFILNWFQKTNVNIDQNEIAQIISNANNIPFYVQYLSYYIWEGKKTNKSVTKAIADLQETNKYVYDEIFSKLPTNQRKALKLVVAKRDNTFTQQNLADYKLKTAQVLNKSLNALIDKGILEKNGVYFFVDPLFEKFVFNL